jgi:hypothetical protein
LRPLDARGFTNVFSPENAESKLASYRGSPEPKKEEFAGHMLYMLPGNSFPRSALFLKPIMGNVSKPNKSTKVLEC